ncbi:hypothetical protein J4216_00980 [Candidatus Woesearchaeota archaeon]|nr:hypothetical protein [Candidatus Woesearchaeota archaeon]
MTEPIKEESQKEEKKKTKIENPFGDIFRGFKELVEPLKEAVITEKKSKTHVVDSDMIGITKDKAKELTYRIYNVYKKNHGMLAT